MIVTRTPHRISLLGGGTDFSDYFSNYGGLVLSLAIDKYVYVTLKEHGKLFDERFRVVYSKTELANKCKDIENSIVRACFEYFNLNNKRLYVSSISDIPSGTGLGSSSAFTVGLLLAIHKYLNIPCTRETIAELACEIEIEILGKKIGKQDQFGVSFPGVKLIEFKKNGVIEVKRQTQLSKFFAMLENDISLIWTGGIRSADPILAEQTENITNGSIIDQLKIIHNNAKNFVNDFQEYEFLNAQKNLKRLITESWFEKKEITKNFNSEELENVDKVLYQLYEQGKVGYKLSGAGGAGFFTVFGEKRYLKNIFGNKLYSINIDNEGAVAISF